jgi:O-acetyl-ADP-ribose deacetylase (regulator of RNase III)
LEECKTLGGCKTGSAKITKGYNLPAKFVIHAVGPVWYGGSRNEEARLASCYNEALQLAKEYNIESIAFPAISCGAYKFPIRRACKIAVNEVYSFLQKENSIKKVIFSCFDKVVEKELKKSLAKKRH